MVIVVGVMGLDSRWSVAGSLRQGQVAAWERWNFFVDLFEACEKATAHCATVCVLLKVLSHLYVHLLMGDTFFRINQCSADY